MKFRITTGHLPNYPNCNRTTASYALHSRHLPGLLLRRPHMPRRTIWLTNPQPTRKRRFLLLHLHLPSHRPRNLLRLVPKQRNLKHRSYPPPNPHSNRLRRIRPTLRTNIILRSYSNHKPILSNPLHRPNTRRMSLRRILSRQPYINTILRPSLPTPICHRRPHTSPPHLPARNRLKQPTGNPIRLRQNPLPPLLHHKGRPRIRTNIHPPSLTSPILPQPTRRPRKLHTRQPPSNTPPHQTRMILPIRLRHSTIHPKQTRRSPSPSRFNPSPILTPSTPHIQTTINDLPTTISNPILSSSHQRPSTNLSRQPTSRTPIHYHWPTSLTHLLHNYPNPIPPRGRPRKQTAKTITYSNSLYKTLVL